MSQPITFPNLPQFQSYCEVADVKNLIGNVAAVANGTVTDTQIQSAIDNATEYIEQQTNKFFSPRRLIEQLDGSGTSRQVLPHDPIININQVQVYFTYPLATSRLAHDWDIIVDREAGILSFPPYSAAPFFAPFAYQFFKQSRNVTVDAWYGFTKRIFGEQLTTTDQKTYTFANPSVVKYSANTIYNPTTPPSFFPIIYKNGQALTNTTYTLVTNTDASANNVWEVQSDNLVFTFHQGANGYDSIIFNSANLSTDVITADYAFWTIPNDIKDICSKKAAMTILEGVSSNQGLTDGYLQGASEIQIDGARVQYQDGGQFGGLLKQWQAQIDAVIKQRKKVNIPLGVGYTEDSMQGW